MWLLRRVIDKCVCVCACLHCVLLIGRRQMWEGFPLGRQKGRTKNNEGGATCGLEQQQQQHRVEGGGGSELSICSAM